MIYVTADLHFNHPGILEMERHNFQTIEEHNQFIINRYNTIVKPWDTVYILGDVGFGNPHLLKKLTRKLKGHKILVRGNHDLFTDTEAVNLLGFEAVYNGPVYFYNNGEAKIILSHEPVCEAFKNKYVINVHGHLHNSVLQLSNFFNVNLAQTGFAPVAMDKFIKEADRYCKSRQETFLQEWYTEYYEFF